MYETRRKSWDKLPTSTGEFTGFQIFQPYHTLSVMGMGRSGHKKQRKRPTGLGPCLGPIRCERVGGADEGVTPKTAKREFNGRMGFDYP